jgi:hypothetical protein
MSARCTWRRLAEAAVTRWIKRGRTNSACSVSSAASSVGARPRIRMLLEPAVGDLAKPIVHVSQQATHHAGRLGSLNDVSSTSAR